MPAVSEAQRRYLYARFGAAWVRRHHFATRGPLPARVAPLPPPGTLERARRAKRKRAA